jgi:hypothetical protein
MRTLPELDILMPCYFLAGQEFHFPGRLPEAALFENSSNNAGTAEKAVPLISDSFLKNELIARTEGWAANAWRMVETWSAGQGFEVRIDGCSDFGISLDGKEIRCAKQERAGEELSETDRQILLGPVLVLALALRGTWSMHASAAIFKDKLVLFLGESGQGKSTLAGYLAGETNWRLAADDILPVTIGSNGVLAWPRFPQLKLPIQAQPGPGLPEHLTISQVCVLSDAGADERPALQRLSTSQAVQVYLGHTAGTRLFTPDLLRKHLTFCSRVAEQVPVYRLNYPHRWETLPLVRELLESIC